MGDMNHFIRAMISAVLIAVVASCGSQSTTDFPIENVDVETARDLVTQDETVIVLDVRTPEEYAIGHIGGAINIDIGDAGFSEGVSKLERNKTYIVHCSANVENGRAAKSQKIMGSLGFKNLLNMVGGIVAWEQSGHPLVRSEFQEEG
jgi:rhodanese-related sulfurtransferase